MSGRPLVMGVVNVTPDSFSDGGRYFGTEAAVVHAHELLELGADIIDIGGESTRPGATRPLVEEELKRVIPVIERVAEAGALISIDTMRAEVADAACGAGATIINDVSGGLADPNILGVAARNDASYVAMHWRAHGSAMQQEQHTDYGGDVVGVVLDELTERIDAALAAGIASDKLIVDPGLGFSKTAEQNWDLLAGIDQFAAMGYPVLVGASRKTFLGHLLATPEGTPRLVGERESAHLAVVSLLALRHVWAVRVHDVRAARDALAAVTAWHQAVDRSGQRGVEL